VAGMKGKSKIRPPPSVGRKGRDDKKQ